MDPTQHHARLAAPTSLIDVAMMRRALAQAKLAVQIGEVKTGDRMVVRHKGVVVADIPAKSLTDEAPIYDQPTSEPAQVTAAREWTPDHLNDLQASEVEDALKQLLSHPTIASKRSVTSESSHCERFWQRPYFAGS